MHFCKLWQSIFLKVPLQLHAALKVKSFFNVCKLVKKQILVEKLRHYKISILRPKKSFLLILNFGPMPFYGSEGTVVGGLDMIIFDFIMPRVEFMIWCTSFAIIWVMVSLYKSNRMYNYLCVAKDLANC